jgi:hypothetical protein
MRASFLVNLVFLVFLRTPTFLCVSLFMCALRVLIFLLLYSRNELLARARNSPPPEVFVVDTAIVQHNGPVLAYRFGNCNPPLIPQYTLGAARTAMLVLPPV